MTEVLLTRGGIRRDAKARLLAANTAVGAKVFASRTVPTKQDKLPCLLVYTMETKGTRSGIGIPAFDTITTLAVEIVCGDLTDEALDDALDVLEEQVKATFLNDAEWVSSFNYVDSLNVQVSIGEDSSARTAGSRVLFDVAYFDSYEPVVTDVLGKVNIRLDAIDPFMPTGPVGVTRTSGPDGRIEGEVNITNLDSQGA